MTTDKTKTESRLAKHLQILNLENNGFSAGELKAEQDGISSMKPPALDLDRAANSLPITKPARSLVTTWYSVAALAVAAMIAVFVYMPKNEEVDGFRVKGQGAVRIYVENDGKVTEWDHKGALANGSRVRVEFKATEDTVAYLGVVSRNQTDLLPIGMIWDRKLTLATGTIGRTEGSIELTGKNEGETVLAVSCPKVSAVPLFEGFAQFWIEVKAASKENAPRVNGCALESIPLR
jgi:hypothetical protein